MRFRNFENPHDQESHTQVEETSRNKRFERNEVPRIDDLGRPEQIDDGDHAGQGAAMQHEDYLIAVGR